ncbi:nitrogen fixation negative regulator NifL [Methylococcus geothermalis]|uniref:histidine kinase n=1 Tax=Methylococcus geothermalis TaxID=2681310 RepID=A0A858Q5X3_9GAMM|nr:nitrogen fixation negative regulator NifL [Methylococcus geothermalis]QJD29262.1 nitrogen fixation negative regulator NifL [Methylococcus geothermalis]
MPIDLSNFEDASNHDLPFSLVRATVDQAPVAISITDLKANILYVNAAFSEITGYAPQECIGRNESMLSDQRTPPEVYRELWGCITRQQAWRGRLLNRHRDGRRYLADLTVAPMLNEAGETTHFIGMHRDITEEYLLQRQVRQQTLFLETVVASIPVSAVLIDENGQIVLDNLMYKALASDLKVEEPALLFLKLLRQESGEEWSDFWHREKAFRNLELRFDPGGGRPSRWFSCAGQWFRHEEGTVDGFFSGSEKGYLLLTVDDVTQQKKQQEQYRLRGLQALMAEEEKLESLKETLFAAIHQIQGPLNLIGAAKNILDRRGDDAGNVALRDLLQQVIAAGEASIGTLEKCIPHTDNHAFKPVNLNQVLHDAITLLTERLLASGIVVEWVPTPVLPSLRGSENRLRSLFKQVIENAIDAMAHSRQRELRIHTWTRDQLIHITIEDTGPGIPPGLRTQVFEPFFTTKASSGRQHVGMGLAVAHEIVNQHNGMIRIDPDYHEGCRIHMQFEIRQTQPERSAKVSHG